jgi:hypothetical protein
MRCLFYPCAGDDIDSPVRAFAAIIDEFWFVDIQTCVRRLPQLSGIRAEYVESSRLEIANSDLVVNSRRFKHPHFNHMVTLNFVTGDGERAFKELFCQEGVPRELSIFFHRGDSQGEGGSNVYWLHDLDSDGNPLGHLKTVISTLCNPGFICTDGSNAIDHFRSHFNQLDAEPDTHVALIPFECHGSILTPIGSLDVKYGPSVVYQAIKRDNFEGSNSAAP